MVSIVSAMESVTFSARLPVRLLHVRQVDCEEQKLKCRSFEGNDGTHSPLACVGLR